MDASGVSEEEARIADLRAHWDARYGCPGRVPLDEPNARFSRWIAGHDDDRPVLLIGDGEGRHARAVPPRHPVTMIELSPVGAATCQARATRPIEVIVADAFRWLAQTDRVWPLVAMLYLPPLTAGEWDAFLTVLRGGQDLGGSFFLEFARAGLPQADEERLSAAFGLDVLHVSAPGDPVERLVLTL